MRSLLRHAAVKRPASSSDQRERRYFSPTQVPATHTYPARHAGKQVESETTGVPGWPESTEAAAPAALDRPHLPAVHLYPVRQGGKQLPSFGASCAAVEELMGAERGNPRGAIGRKS